MKTLRVSTAALLVLAAALPAGAQAPAAAKKPADAPQSLMSELAGKTFEQWKADLTHPDASTRVEAIVAVTMFGPLASEVVPLLLNRCNDTDASPRVKAIIALTMIDVPPKDVPKVIEGLARRLSSDSQAIVRYQAAAALQRFAGDPAARAAIDALIRGAQDPSSYEIRSLCVALLRQAARDSKTGPEYRVSQALIKAAMDPTAQVRLEAAISLGALGRPADPQVLQTTEKSLLTLARDRDKVVCVWAQVGLMALMEKIPDEKIAALAKGLGSADARVRLHTARALGGMGDKAKRHVPDLLRALSDKEPDVIAEAVAALVEIGDPAPKVLDSLAEVSTRKGLDEGVRAAARSAVEQLKKTKK